MNNRWKIYFEKKHAVLLLAATVVVTAVCVFFMSRFIIFVEGRQGVVLQDPLFDLFGAVNLNIPIFALIYGSLLLCFVYLLVYSPPRLVIALQTYSLMLLVRMFMMYVTPLEPPLGTIDLQDPLIFVVGTGMKITKDLFFSGHTSTLFMLFLVTDEKKLKAVFLINTFLVGLFVILQKAHYTVDVLVAPFVSFAVYTFIFYLNSKVFKVIEK